MLGGCVTSEMIKGHYFYTDIEPHLPKQINSLVEEAARLCGNETHIQYLKTNSSPHNKKIYMFVCQCSAVHG